MNLLVMENFVAIIVLDIRGWLFRQSVEEPYTWYCVGYIAG
jgi:hypothetical protein